MDKSSAQPQPQASPQRQNAERWEPQVNVRTRELIYNPGARYFLEAVAKDSALSPGKGDPRLMTVSGSVVTRTLCALLEGQGSHRPPPCMSLLGGCEQEVGLASGRPTCCRGRYRSEMQGKRGRAMGVLVSVDSAVHCVVLELLGLATASQFSRELPEPAAPSGVQFYSMDLGIIPGVHFLAPLRHLIIM